MYIVTPARRNYILPSPQPKLRRNLEFAPLNKCLCAVLFSVTIHRKSCITLKHTKGKLILRYVNKETGHTPTFAFVCGFV